MTVKELATFLGEHLVPAELYMIGGNDENRICLEHSANGWDVFFSEKKNKIGNMHFNDETSACTAMKNEMRKMMEVMYGLTWVTA